MFMPQNDHDYHNINAMHVHTKNDHDYDSAIHIQTSSFMIIPFSLNRDQNSSRFAQFWDIFTISDWAGTIMKNIKLYWEILPCVRDLQLYSMTVIVLVDQDDDYDDNHLNDNYNDDQGLYQSTHSLQWS